jgi:hypothetical protein
MYEVGLEPGFMSEWTEVARANLRRALAERFTASGPVVIRELDATRADAVARAIEELPLWPVSQYGSIQTKAAYGPALACLSSPAAALAETAETDAVLVTYAVEAVKTARTTAVGAIFGVIDPFNWLFLPVWLSTDPKGWAGSFWGRGRGAIQSCLVDPRAAEVLWIHLEEWHSEGLLRDPVKVDAVIERIHRAFQATMAVPGTRGA